jgi:hypothetical protein
LFEMPRLASYTCTVVSEEPTACFLFHADSPHLHYVILNTSEALQSKNTSIFVVQCYAVSGETSRCVKT